MKHSIGKSLAAGTAQEIFTVPNGYHAIVSMVFITNTAGSTGSYDMSWNHAHDVGHVIRFAYGKSLSSGASDQFSNGELVMKAGDKMTITNTVNVDVIVTFDLIQAMPLYAFAGE
jgi:hypothetical protein